MRPSRAASLLLAPLLVAVLGQPPSARASGATDAIEHLLGATNVHAITGNGGLSVGVSREGDLSVLTWPSPSYCDQLTYVSSNAFDAREMPRFGATESMGSFLGLVVETAGSTRVVWLRDLDEVEAQRYSRDDSSVPVTRRRDDALGLEVEVLDVVPGDLDVLARGVRVTRDAASPVTSVSLLVYANLGPSLSRVPEIPLADWALDARNDFVALWDDEATAVIHFQPGDTGVVSALGHILTPPVPDFGPAGALLGSATVADEDVASLARELDGRYAPGVYLALSTEPAPTSFQIGYDRTPVCASLDALLDNLNALPDRLPGLELPVDPAAFDVARCTDPLGETRTREGWMHEAESAFADAADGALSGSRIAAGAVDEALLVPLDFDASGNASATVLLAAAATADAARAALSDARARGFETMQGDAEADAAAWLADLVIPVDADPAVLRTATRALLNIRIGIDRTTGAIVASLSRQPPYGEDWPRDGVFFNVLLDVAGLTDLVSQRLRWYATLQRPSPIAPTPLVDPPPPVDPDTGQARTYPAGAWEMNYYADGMVGGQIRFEIDNTALMVWSMVAHTGYLPESEREAWLAEMWPSVSTGADLLARWRDPETGLHAPAQEDDNAGHTQTLHGAVTVFGALDLAARAARANGDDARATAYETRAAELRDAILVHFYRDGRFVTGAGATVNPGSAASGPTAWLAWPARALPFDDARIVAQVRSDLDDVLETLRFESEGGAYVLKNTATAALVLGDDPDGRADVESTLATLAGSATEGTAHFGEVFVSIGGGRVDQRVATPHLWEGAL
ncbi:MAG: hypothetical protein IT379_42955, partial [Deltaproteobacteria bacterium]|nr:hypothetical protein [Deltaproteobacteria bacterium]